LQNRPLAVAALAPRAPRAALRHEDDKRRRAKERLREPDIQKWQ